LVGFLAVPLSALGELEKVLKIPPPGPELKIDFSGERLKYDALWIGLKSGEAEINVSSVNGHYKISAFSRTVGPARVLYKLDDAVAAETTPEFAPVSYSLQIREPAFKHNRFMVIDRKTKTANAKRVSVGTGKVKERVFTFHQGFDPAGLTYLVRTLDWKPGMKQCFEFLDGKDRSLILLEAGPIENVKTKAGTFRAIRLKPFLFILPKTKEKETPELVARIKNKQTNVGFASWAYFWIALDGKRPIILARANSLIGPVALELTSMTSGSLESASSEPGK